MASRVWTIDSVGEDRDRVAADSEGDLMVSTFDPIRTTSDDNPLAESHGSGKLPGHAVTVGGSVG